MVISRSTKDGARSLDVVVGTGSGIDRVHRHATPCLSEGRCQRHAFSPSRCDAASIRQSRLPQTASTTWLSHVLGCFSQSPWFGSVLLYYTSLIVLSCLNIFFLTMCDLIQCISDGVSPIHSKHITLLFESPIQLLFLHFVNLTLSFLALSTNLSLV